jgi:hypothetical protein
VIRVTQDRVLVRPLRPVKAWVKDVAGDDPELQRLAINLANPYSDPVTMGAVVAIGELGLVPMAAVRGAFADLAETGELLETSEIAARLRSVAPAAPDFAVDDVIVFSPFVGQEFTVEGDEYIVLRAGDVLGVVEPTPA